MTISPVDLKSTRERIEQFTKKLRQNHIDDFTATRLEEVLGAIGSNPYLWLNLNLYDVLNPSMVIDRARIAYTNRRSIIGILEILRNVLVLFPIVLTWYALSQATNAYSIIGKPELNIPFLYQWEQGFNGLMPSLWGYTLTFSHVAFLDAMIIGGIILLTIIVFLGSYKAEQSAINLGAELDSLLWQINIAINADLVRVKGDAEHRSIELLESINSFVDEFKQQGQDLNNVFGQEINRFETIIKDYKDLTGSLKTISIDLRDSTNQLEVLKIEVEEIGSNQDQIEGSILNIEGQLGGFDTIITEFGRSLEKVASNLSSNVNMYTDGMGKFSVFSKQFLDKVQDLQTPDGSAKESIAKLGEAMIKLNSSTEHMNKHLESISTDLTQLRKTFSNIAGAPSNITQQRTFVDKVKDFFR